MFPLICALNNTNRIVQYTVWGCQAVSVNFGGVLKHLVVFPISSLVEYFAGVLLVVACAQTLLNCSRSSYPLTLPTNIDFLSLTCKLSAGEGMCVLK